MGNLTRLFKTFWFLADLLNFISRITEAFSNLRKNPPPTIVYSLSQCAHLLLGLVFCVIKVLLLLLGIFQGNNPYCFSSFRYLHFSLTGEARLETPNLFTISFSLFVCFLRVLHQVHQLICQIISLLIPVVATYIHQLLYI